MKPVLSNPFNFETPADRRAFTDRERLLPKIEGLLSQTRQRALIHGRRRMGKTSLINQAIRTNRHLVARADLSVATNLNEVAQILIGSIEIPEASTGARLFALLKKHVQLVSLKGGRFALETHLRAPAEKTLEQVLSFLDDYAELSDAPLTVWMDEFQDIRKLAGEGAETRLRGLIQNQKRLSYLFSGSEHRLLAWMAGTAESPFYKQLELIEVGPIDPELLAAWIDQRTRRAGLLDRSFGADVVRLAGPCTGDIVRLAKDTFVLAAEQKTGNIVRHAFEAIALQELTSEFVTLWSFLPESHRVFLRILADGRAPFASKTLTDYNITVGAAGSAQTALFERQLLIRAGSHVAFDNPFFCRWVAEQGPGGP